MIAALLFTLTASKMARGAWSDSSPFDEAILFLSYSYPQYVDVAIQKLEYGKIDDLEEIIVTLS